MKFRRLKQVCLYGWKDAAIISQKEGVNQSRFSIFCDMLFCYLKYNVWTNQYKKGKLYSLDKDARKAICLKYQETNTKRDQWVKEFFDNYKFLNKWSSFKYEQSASLQAKRRAAYKKQYGLGNNCFIGYDVIFNRHHYSESTLSVYDNCHIAEQCVFDYTGGLTLENGVTISEGVKILTHNHSLDFMAQDSDTKGFQITPLVLKDHSSLGARVIVMPGVTEIGRGAMISAGTILRKPVPPYSIVTGNPGRVVGFRYPPEIIHEYEEMNYPENERIPMKQLEENYSKYFVSKIKVIQEYLSV